MALNDLQKPKRPKHKRSKGVMPTPIFQRVEGYGISHEEWVDRFDVFLADRGCSLYGRAFDIHSSAGRRECAEFLARSVEGVIQ